MKAAAVFPAGWDTVNTGSPSRLVGSCLLCRGVEPGCRAGWVVVGRKEGLCPPSVPGPLGAPIILRGGLTSGLVDLSGWKSLSSTRTEKTGFREEGSGGGSEWGLWHCLTPLMVDSGVKVKAGASSLHRWGPPGPERGRLALRGSQATGAGSRAQQSPETTPKLNGRM